MNEEVSTFLRSFDSNFCQYKTHPLVLYGIGEKTRWILDNLPDYQIIGLMDKDTTGKIVYGKKVLTYDEVVSKARMIIIVANMASNKIIFTRIRSLHDNYHIPVFYTDGTQPENITKSSNHSSQFGLSPAMIKDQIIKADVISFDLFDTLIMRKTYLPTDVFDLVEERAKDFIGPHFSFKVPRIEAEKYCFSLDVFYTIDSIYARLQEILKCGPQIIGQLRKEEIDAEVLVSIPRKDVVDLYSYAVSLGKKVCITTDTYLDKDSVEKLLQNANIPSPHAIFISCVIRKSKASGTIWDHIKNAYRSDTILHIGDNEITDCEKAREYGISVVQVKNGSDLMDRSLGTIPQRARTSADRLVMGLISSRFLNSPFALSETKGKIQISTMFDLGYLCFGPLVYSYIRWLIENVQYDSCARVLFFSRDGYLLKDLYDLTANNLHIAVPEGIYFLTSRRSASVLSLEKKEDIAFLAESLCRYKKNTLREILYLAFGVKIVIDDPILETRCFDMEDKDIIRYLTGTYGDEILTNAQEERNAYLAYIDRHCLNTVDHLFCVNFVGRGATQHFLSKVLKRSMTGYYFAVDTFSRESFFENTPMEGLYDSFPGDVQNSHLLRQYVFGEIVLTSPDEQFVRFQKNGEPEYDTQGTKRDYSQIQECHNGIREFFKDVLMIHNTSKEQMSLDIVDELYGLFISGRCIVSDEVRDALVFKDYYDASAPCGNILEI